MSADESEYPVEGTKETISNLPESQPLLMKSPKLTTTCVPTRASVSERAGWVQKAWLLHGLLGLAVLAIGMQHNHGESKFVPVNISELQGMECKQAFANALSSTGEEEGAIKCCPVEASHYDWTEPCGSAHALPLSMRLTKFPYAWMIPLLPWCLRVVWEMLVLGLRKSVLLPSLERLSLYIGIMMIRGWVLYLGFNMLEEFIFKRKIMPEANEQDVCWYLLFLNKRSLSPTSICYGRLFDFSDHVVFYFVQVLAIIWMELLDTWCRCCPPSPILFPQGIILLRRVMFGLVAYLHLIVYMSAYKTARWFHTSEEIFTGWVIAMLVTVPLAWWQIRSLGTVQLSRNQRLS